jgi:hypothetical protein
MDKDKLNEGMGSQAVRRMVRAASGAALATLNPDGFPYASLVNIATDAACRPLLLISKLAWHTRNLANDERASLLIVDPAEAGDPLEGARATLIGRFETAGEEAVRRRFLARHPRAAGYAGFADFSLWRMLPETVHVVAGFGRIRTFPAADMLLETKTALQFAGIESSAIEHLNEDHEDAVALFWQACGGSPSAAVRAVAVDADGIDLSDGETVRRLSFDRVLKDGAELRQELATLAARLRAEARRGG